MNATAAPDNFRAGLWLIADMSLNIWALTLVKALGGDYPAAQVVFLRAATGLVLILPWVLRERAALAQIDRWGLHLGRVALSTTALTASFFAITRMPFALFTALGFTRPLVLMAMAALILHERIPARRWVAAGVGLAGVLIAVSPGSAAWTWGIPAALVTVLAGNGAVIVTRKLRGTPPVVMMLFYTAGLAALTAPVAAAVWVPLAPGHLWPLLAVGAFAQTAQYCFLRAHWLGDAGVLGPLGYLSLVLSGAVGYLVFAEVPSAGMLAGAAVIVLATALVSDRRR